MAWRLAALAVAFDTSITAHLALLLNPHYSVVQFVSLPRTTMLSYRRKIRPYANPAMNPARHSRNHRRSKRNRE
jgi:hypothetical protein